MDAIERCRAEIAAMEQQEDAPAWLTTLGITDWECEMELLKPREDEPTSVLQTFTGCTLVYDLTAHRIVVTAQDGSELLMVQPLPDNPGGFSLANEGQSIAIHNPGGVDFVGVHDQFEDNKALFG